MVWRISWGLSVSPALELLLLSYTLFVIIQHQYEISALCPRLTAGVCPVRYIMTSVRLHVVP